MMTTTFHTATKRASATAGPDRALAAAQLCLLLALLLLPWIGGTLLLPLFNGASTFPWCSVGLGTVSGTPVAVWPLALLALLAAAGWLGWALTDARALLPRAPLRWPLMAWVAVTLIATLTSVYQEVSTLALCQVWIVAALTLLALRLPLTRAQLYTGAVLFAADFLLCALFGIRDGYLAGWRVQGTWENANCFAGYLLLGLPLLTVLVRYATRMRWRLLAGAAVCSGLVALLLTQSRGGVLAFLLTLLVFAPAWLWAERKLSGRGIALLAAGFVLLVGLTLLSPVGARVLNPRVRAQQQHSQQFRYYTWQSTLRMTRHYPWLGSGPNTFLSVFGQYQVAGYTRHAHQSYLETAAESGTLGLSVTLWLLLAVLLTGVRALRHLRGRTLPDGERALLTSVAIAQGASTLGVLLHGFFDSDWCYLGMQLLLLLQAAWVWRLIDSAAPAEAPAAAPARWSRFVWAAALLLTVLVLLPRCGAEQLAGRAQEEERGRTRQDVGALYRQAQRLAPMNANYRRLAAQYASYAEGVGAFQQAMRLEPTNAANWLNYGHFALRYHALAAATAAYATAEQKEPNFLPALYGLARANWLQGDQAGARDAVRHILTTVDTPMDRYRPIDVPESWYLRAWYAEGVFAVQARDAQRANIAFSHALDAAERYQQGFSTEAKAQAEFTGNTSEREEVYVLASLAHEQLAGVLDASNPMAAQQERAAMLTDFHHPADLLQLPFPELYQAPAKK